MLRKTFAGLFIMALLFNTSGAYLLFSVYRAQVRKEIKKQIKQSVPADQLHYLTFDLQEVEDGSSGIRWIHDAEFVYKGKMYDIVSKATENGKITYACINDHQEEKLFEHLSSLENQQCKSDRQAQQKQRLVNLMLGLTFIQPLAPGEQGLPEFSAPEMPYLFSFQNEAGEVPTPPPNRHDEACRA